MRTLFLSLMAAAASAQPPSDAPKQQTVRQLVSHLGDPSFVQRELAEKELLRRGIQAKAELVAALKHSDLEIQIRSRALLVRIAAIDLEQRLAAFTADTAGGSGHSLPGWRRYREMAGGKRAARELFAGMVRAESRLLRAVEEKSPSLAAMLAERMLIVRSTPTANRNLPTATLAALLFAGTAIQDSMDTSMSHAMYSFLSTYRAKFSKGVHADLLQKLFLGWIDQGAMSALGAQYLLLAMRNNLGEAGLRLGRKLVNKQGVPIASLPYAILLIGKYGSEQDVPLLEPLLTNSSLIQKRQIGGQQVLFEVQVRDVAFAATIHLTHQQHTDYGLNQVQKYSPTVYRIQTIGFADQKQRATAFEKWKSWSAQHAKDARPPNNS